ncbi:MAG: response regulator transcription factor [Gammaproteobacteria bacterium]|nr:response regulator transcription factor [Gammaproteobacteria bacterium]
MKSILLVEDDKDLGTTMEERLEKTGLTVVWKLCLKDARKALEKGVFDLVVLDVGLPDGSGFEFAKDVVSNYLVPFLFVTAETSAEQRLQGYELGAEEYIPKPFHLKEFLLRVNHVLANHSLKQQISVQGVIVDFQHLTINKDGKKPVKMPVKDMQVLKLLFDSSPNIVSRDEILDRIWGQESYPSHRTVDNTILRLRQSLGLAASVICSVRGVGYQWLEQ